MHLKFESLEEKIANCKSNFKISFKCRIFLLLLENLVECQLKGTILFSQLYPDVFDHL